MCKLGDIIVVKEFIDKKGIKVSKHSFVVINDEPDYIEGYSYDFIANIMCSFHNQEHKKHKLQFKSNIEVLKHQIIGKKLNNKEGFIRADELFYFNKKKIEYQTIGQIDINLLDKLVKIIIILDRKKQIYKVTNNL